MQNSVQIQASLRVQVLHLLLSLLFGRYTHTYWWPFILLKRAFEVQTARRYVWLLLRWCDAARTIFHIIRHCCRARSCRNFVLQNENLLLQRERQRFRASKYRKRC